MITALITSFLSANHLLPILLSQFAPLIYIGLFLIIFLETGLVVLPFLPGESILFIAGTIAAANINQLNPVLLVLTLSLAAILGDAVNFEIGKRFGHHIAHSSKWQRWIKPKRLAQAHAFYAKHGKVTIFLGRFIPVIRSLVPFTAGSSELSYRQFMTFNILGGVTWVTLAILSGFFLGSIAFVQTHLELLMLGLILISLIPAGIMALKKRKAPVAL